MKIVCLITDDAHNGFTNWFEPSCHYHKLDVLVINYQDQYTSHILKDMALLEYVNSCENEEVILFTDAYDVMLLADEEEILEKYNSFNAPLVFSAEINCWPDAELAHQYPKNTANSFFRYLNSGGFIGRRAYIKQLIEKYYLKHAVAYDKFGWSNQYIWNQIYLKEQDIKLDHNGEIFYTLSSSISISRRFNSGPTSSIKEQALEEDKKRLINELTFENFRVKSKLTGTQPCQLHFTSPTTKYLMETDFFKPLCPWN